MLVVVNTQQTHTSSVEHTLRDFWDSRPRRPRGARKIAGVAAGLGNRYGIDPVVIRVAVVVATIFGGAGILFYLLCWLLLPEDGDESAPLEALFGKGRSSTSKGFTVLLCLAMFPVSSQAFFRNDAGGGFLGLLLFAGALFLLHRNRGHLRRPVPTVQETTMHTPMSAGYPAYSAGSGDAQATAPPDQQGPWDPLGAAPLAWDLPDPVPPPSEPEPPQPRTKSKVGPATLGIALLVGGTGVVLNQFGVPWFSPAHIIGTVLGVLGIGMVVGAFAGGGRGLVVLAVPLAVAGLLLTWVSPDQFRGDAGNLRESPTTLSQVRPVYEVSAGELDLNLTELPDSGTVNTKVRAGAGDVVVNVPNTADVRLTCNMNLGSMDCLGRIHDGMRGTRMVEDNGPDGKGGLKINLDADVAMGNLVVQRG